MQHCLTDCNEPQIDQATPGTAPLPCPALPSWTHVSVGQSLANFICNQPLPLTPPPLSLFRCWQQLPLVVAALPPPHTHCRPLAAENCNDRVAFCQDIAQIMNWLLGGVAEVWAVLGTEFPAGNSHEIRMKFIGLAREREGGR